MKSLAIVMFMSLAVFMTGCATTQRTYFYDSNKGTACFHACESEMWTCISTCLKNNECQESCRNAAHFCKTNCPDFNRYEDKEL